VKVPSHLTRFRAYLISELRKVGVQPQVSIEPVGRTKLHRLTVVAPEFEDMLHSERQSLVWRMADEALKAEEKFTISMILTLAPEDVEPSDKTGRPKRAKSKTAPQIGRAFNARKAHR
jgi:hypothetical protein